MFSKAAPVTHPSSMVGDSFFFKCWFWPFKFIYLFIYIKNIYLFIWLRQVLVRQARGIFAAACGIFLCSTWASLLLWRVGSVVVPRGMWDLSSLTRDQTRVPPCIGRQILNHWTTREVPYVFWLRLAACRILVPSPRIEPVPRAVEARSLNHWTAREVPDSLILCFI